MGRDERLYDALANERRRYALREILQHETMALADLAECVAETETGTPIRDLSAEQVSQVYFSLYHTHVPKLEEDNLLAYDQENDLVTKTEELVPALTALRTNVGDILDATS